MELSKVDSMATVNDVSTASDVSDPRHPASGSPTLSAATSKLSPQRSRLMKDQETQLSELKKENFGLKLRIYHLEEALRKQMGNDSDDWRLSVDLNVALGSLKKELKEKNELLLKAKHAMDGMALQHESHIKKLNEDFAARLAEEKRKLQSAILDRETQFAGMESAQEQQRQQLEDEIARLKAELDDAYNELAEKEEEVKELQEGCVELDPLRREAEELSAQLVATEDELKAVQDALQDKDEQLQGLKDELSGKDKELGERNRELEQVKGELERAKSDMGQQASASDEQERELDNLRRKMKDLQVEAQEGRGLRAALKKKDGEVEALRDALQELERELEEAKRDMSELVDDRQSVQDQYGQDLNDALADNDALKDQLQDLEKKLESLGPELSKRDAAIARLQQALRDKEEQVGQQDQQLLDLSTRKAAEVGVLEKALADLRGVVEQQGDAEKDLKAQIASLEEELEGLRKSAANHASQMAQTRGPAHAAGATSDSDQLDEAESVRELRSQLESLRRRLGQKEAEVERMEDELAHKDSVIRGLKEDLRRARANASAADQRRRDTEREASKLRDQLEALQSRLAHDREGSVDAHTSVGSQTPPLVQGNHTMAELEGILTELRGLLEQLSARGRSKETTNYFNLSSSQQPTDQMDLLERLLRVLSTDREPRIIQPSPVHVNVTVPSNQGSPIINVPPSPQHQVTVTDGSPKLEVRHVMNESSQAVPMTESASQTLPWEEEEEGQGAGGQLKELQTQNQEAINSLRRLKASLSAAEKDNALLLQKNNELAADREAMLEENAILTDQGRSMEKLVRDLSQQVEELAQEREKMVEKLQDAGEMISELQDRVTALQHEGAEKEDLIVELRRRVAHLQDQLAALSSQPARKAPSHKDIGVGVSESEEEADLSGIYDRLKELQLENKKLKRGLTDESKLAAESQQQREAEMDSLQTKLSEAQDEIDQLREIARRSRTPDSRASTPFGMLPPPHPVAKETTSAGVQTHWCRADKAVLVQSESLQWDSVGRSSLGIVGGGLQSGVQHSPASTPPAPPLDASWPSTTSGVGGRDGEDSRLEDSRQAHDLSALDEQYQAGLRLNQLAQQRIAQQLLGASGRPVVVDMGTGTAPSAMVDQGTSPVAVADPSDALHSELAAAQEEALRLAQQLQVSQDTQLTKEGEVVRLHSELVQSQAKMAALESQLTALQKEKNESITSLEKQRNTLLRKYKKAKSEIERLRMDLERAKVTEGVQAGPSVGEMSERSRRLEEEIEAMTSQLHATAASQTALLEELELKEKETEQLMNHVAALTKELQVYQAAQNILPTIGGRQDEVTQTDQKGEVPQQALPADFATLMKEVGQLRDKMDASIRSNRDLSKELKRKLKEPLRTQTKTTATQASAARTTASSVDDTTTISSSALTSQHNQTEGTRPSSSRAGKREEKGRPKEEPVSLHSASVPMLHKGAEVSTPRRPDGKASSFAGRPSNITFQHPAAYSTPYPHQLLYSDSDEPLMSEAYLPTGGAQQGRLSARESMSVDRGRQRAGADDKSVQCGSERVGPRPARLFQGETHADVASSRNGELSGPALERWGWGSERRSRIPRPTGHVAPANGTHSVQSEVSCSVQHGGVTPPVARFTVPLQRGTVGTQASLLSSVGVQSGTGSLDASAQASRMVRNVTQVVQNSSGVGEGEPVDLCDSILTWSRATAGAQSSPLHVPPCSQWGTAEGGHTETVMKRKKSPLQRPVQHSQHSPPSHHTSLSHAGLPRQPSQQDDVSDADSTATFTTFASEADQVESHTRDSGTGAVPLRVVQLRDTPVQTTHSGSLLLPPSVPPCDAVLVDSAAGSDATCSQVDKMIQTVQEAQRKLTHMLAVPELTLSDRKFLEGLLQCLRQQQAELEEGRRLLSQLQRAPSRNASSQTSPAKSPAPSSSSSLAGRVQDLSDLYQQLLDTHGHALGAKDNLKKYHSKRRRAEESEP